jgi:hypothetical protein
LFCRRLRKPRSNGESPVKYPGERPEPGQVRKQGR